MTRDRIRALRYPVDDIDKVGRLVELHLRFHTYGMGWTDSAVRRYVRDAGDLLEELNELTRCRSARRVTWPGQALAQRMEELEARIGELREKEELAAIRPDLDGREIMAHLGRATRPRGRTGARLPSRGAPGRRSPLPGRGPGPAGPMVGGPTRGRGRLTADPARPSGRRGGRSS